MNYTKLALSLRQVILNRQPTSTEVDIVIVLADALSQDNPRFSKQRFLETVFNPPLIIDHG